MAITVRIGHDVTAQNVVDIQAAFSSGEASVSVCNSICMTERGRTTLKRHLRRVGCDPTLVSRLGFVTSMPKPEAPAPAQPPSPSSTPVTPTVTESVQESSPPVMRRQRRKSPHHDAE